MTPNSASGWQEHPSAFQSCGPGAPLKWFSFPPSVLPDWRPGQEPPARQAPRAIIILEREWSQCLAHVPLHMSGQHALEDMGQDMVGRIDMDRPDPQMRFCRSECSFDPGEALVGSNRFLWSDGSGTQAGPDDIDAIKTGLACNLLCPPPPSHLVIGDLEVFLHLPPVDPNQAKRSVS